MGDMTWCVAVPGVCPAVLLCAQPVGVYVVCTCVSPYLQVCAHLCELSLCPFRLTVFSFHPLDGVISGLSC